VRSVAAAAKPFEPTFRAPTGRQAERYEDTAFTASMPVFEVLKTVIRTDSKSWPGAMWQISGLTIR